jgi:hypothetical protein
MLDHFDDEAEGKPPSEASKTGVLWDLTDEAFDRWWRLLPRDDAEEFIGVFGGDNILARFVCAYHHIKTFKPDAQPGAAIVTAYAVAAKLPFEAPETRVRASKAWRHDAVQALVARLESRSLQLANARILNATTNLIEVMIQQAHGAKASDQAQVVKAAMAFANYVQKEQLEERNLRLKSGWAATKDRLENATEGGEIEQPSPEKAVLYLRMLRDQMGADVFNALALPLLEEHLASK